MTSCATRKRARGQSCISVGHKRAFLIGERLRNPHSISKALPAYSHAGITRPQPTCPISTPSACTGQLLLGSCCSRSGSMSPPRMSSIRIRCCRGKVVGAAAAELNPAVGLLADPRRCAVGAERAQAYRSPLLQPPDASSRIGQVENESNTCSAIWPPLTELDSAGDRGSWSSG